MIEQQEGLVVDEVIPEPKALCLIEEGEWILIGKKKKELRISNSDVWIIPEVKVAENETDEEALQREVHEELGINVKIKSFLGEEESHRFYLCPINESEPALNVGKDLADARFVPKIEALPLISPYQLANFPPGVTLRLTGAKDQEEK